MTCAGCCAGFRHLYASEWVGKLSDSQMCFRCVLQLRRYRSSGGRGLLYSSRSDGRCGRSGKFGSDFVTRVGDHVIVIQGPATATDNGGAALLTGGGQRLSEGRLTPGLGWAKYFSAIEFQMIASSRSHSSFKVIGN